MSGGKWGGRRAQKIRAELAETLPAICWRCGGWIMPGMKWDVGHLVEVDRDPEAAYDLDGYAPEHAYCNRAAGAAYGNRKRAGLAPRPKSPTSRQWVRPTPTSRRW